MSKWKGTPEGLNSAQAAMIHRTNRDEALDILEEHSFGGLSDWMDWRTRKEALLDRLREPEEICHTCGAERGIHPKSWCEVPKKTVRERVDEVVAPEGKSYDWREGFRILADAIDEMRK
jgi:hypothetical protein